MARCVSLIDVWAKRRASGVARLALGLLVGCGPAAPKIPDKEAVRLPSASLVDPSGSWLFVTQGNWDRLHDYSVLSVYDMAGINQRWDEGGGQGCTAHEDPERGPVCDLGAFALASATRLLPSGAGNMVLDRRPEAKGGRLLIPTRHQSAVVWLDLVTQGRTLNLECGQREGDLCSAPHVLNAVGPEPARLYLDQQGFDFAYLPHLQDNRISLLSLKGPSGPSLVDQEEQFFSPTKIGERDFGGGFGLAQLPCDPVKDFVPRSARDCSRPYLYGAQRFVYGVRPFSVAPGRQVLLSGAELPLWGHAQEEATSSGWPTMGAMWVRDTSSSPELFVIQHEPPMLLRVSLALDARGNPENRLLDGLALCDRADLLQGIPGPRGQERLALSCPTAGELWIVEPDAMRLAGIVKVGRGANELDYEPSRQRLWVTNTLEHSLSVVDLDPASPNYLTERMSLVAKGRNGTSASAGSNP